MPQRVDPVWVFQAMTCACAVRCRWQHCVRLAWMWISVLLYCFARVSSRYVLITEAQGMTVWGRASSSLAGCCVAVRDFSSLGTMHADANRVGRGVLHVRQLGWLPVALISSKSGTTHANACRMNVVHDVFMCDRKLGSQAMPQVDPIPARKTVSKRCLVRVASYPVAWPTHRLTCARRLCPSYGCCGVQGSVMPSCGVCWPRAPPCCGAPSATCSATSRESHVLYIVWFYGVKRQTCK